MAFEQECPNSGRFFGCRFEARYDTAAADGEAVVNVIREVGTDDDMEAAFDALRSRAYVRDICVRCGRAVERAEAKP